MKELVLVIGPALPDAARALCTAPGYSPSGKAETESGQALPERLVAHWDGWEAPNGEISLSARLRDELTAIRAEHMAWAHDLGRMRVGGREMQQHLRCGEKLSMWWCSLLYERHPKMTPGLYTVYKLRSLERLMDEGGFASLRVFGGDEDLRGALARMCKSGHRLFAECREAPVPLEPARSLLRKVYDATPPPLRALARYAHWWWTVRRHMPPVSAKSPLPPAQGQAATIATYFPNVDMKAAENGRYRSRYWESLHDALNATAGVETQEQGSAGEHAQTAGHFVRWLFIRFPAPQLSLAQCIALRDRFRREGRDGASFHYLEEFLTTGDLIAALFRYARLCLASLRLEKEARAAFRFAGSKLDFWTYLGPYWAESFRGWRCLERCLQHRAFKRYAAMAGPQRWTLFPLENCPWERMLTQTMHEANNGPVIGAQHSTIRPTDFRYFDDPRTFTGDLAEFQPDMVRGNGQSACSQWREAGVPAERLGEVEALRYLYLANNDAQNASAAASHDSTPAPRRLLAVTSFFADETEAHLALLARSLHAGLLDGWEIRVKPHPYLPVQERLKALLGRRAQDVQVVDGPIADQLAPGVVVWASNSTTVALEAAIKGLPVVAMLPTDDFDLCPLQDVASLPRTGSVDDVARALQTAAPLHLPPEYLDLNVDLPKWKTLLHLRGKS
ncbi:hypothetical protein SDC9_06697 [bioreactor metagenome]|uniref:Uncharacterized protein n=1 Tax=bioreactor metagenome TaxID=1076179 RepID=A0A644T2Z2_9ZZZZ|nr:TIGR04326 family surface carbohydrate biosynthesis protein [Desulfovibrio desulfuricans]MEA4991292.1 TIGR04326 family surface carbohydrate biosynthesis protein [Desulfovibrio desulfuricans]